MEYDLQGTLNRWDMQPKPTACRNPTARQWEEGPVRLTAARQLLPSSAVRWTPHGMGRRTRNARDTTCTAAPAATSCPGAGAAPGAKGSATPDSLLAQVMPKPSLTATQQTRPHREAQEREQCAGKGIRRGRGMRRREPGAAASTPSPAPCGPWDSAPRLRWDGDTCLLGWSASVGPTNAGETLTALGSLPHPRLVLLMGRE